MTKREIPAGLVADPAWRAALHILTSPLFAHAGGVWACVDLKERSIDFETMMNLGWSGGERRMLRIAASLFNPQFTVALWEDLGNLDHRNVQIVLEAIRLFTDDPIGEAMRKRLESFAKSQRKHEDHEQ